MVAACHRACQGYHQISVAVSDIPKTAIITPFGLFEYLFTPFRLSNAAGAFQRMMDRTTEGLESVLAYMDDSRVGFPDNQTHLRHLEIFFSALPTNGLAINLEKCIFAMPSLETLGHKILAAGAAPTAAHTAKIELCPPPQDIKQLQCFLGMVNFYRRFLPNCAQVLRPLTDLLRGGGRPRRWSGPHRHRRHSRMQNASWQRRYPSNIPPQMQNFLLPLMPLILISEGLCSKNLATIGGPANSAIWLSFLNSMCRCCICQV
jgi:hypothetical protein